VYNAIRQELPESKIILMGDSAGGGLAVSALDELQEDNTDPFSAVVLLSPWINLRCNTASYEIRKDKDPILTKEQLTEYAGYYVNDKLNQADPGQLWFEKFPPLFLAVGSNEVLY